MLALLAAGCGAPSEGGSPVPTPPPGATARGFLDGPATSLGAPRAVTVAIVDVTEDGIVLVTRGWATPGHPSGARSLEAYDAGARTFTTLAPAFAEGDRVVVSGQVVAFWTGVDRRGLGTLTAWSKAHGATRLSTASFAGVFSASADGTRAAYVTRAGDGTGDLVAGSATASDGQEAEAAVHGVGLGGGSCDVSLGFVGSRLFAAACAPGSRSAAVHTVSATGDVLTVATSVRPSWSASKSGREVLLIGADGAAWVHTIPENTRALVDRDVTWAALAPDAGRAVYRNESRELRTLDLGVPNAGSTVLAEGLQGVSIVSPNFQSAFISTLPADVTNARIARQDLLVAPLFIPPKPFIPTPTGPELLVRTPTARAIGFSPAGRALFLADLPATGLPAGTLKVHGPDGDRLIAEGVLAPQAARKSSLVAYAVHAQLRDGEIAAVDVEVADVDADTKALLVSGVDPNFALAGSVLAYTVGGRELLTKALPERH